MEHIDLKDFDIMGIFTLKDVAGIEKYVTEVSGNEYLSRSREYYQQKNFTELSNDRDMLNSLLTIGCSRKNFVILENMLNASAKVYYASLKDHILHGETKIYDQAKICFEEDVQNIVSILSGNKIKKSTHKLPKGEIKTPDRAIELDNKALLYIFCDTIRIPKDKHILTPGYGSLYLGQFLHCIKGNMYSNLLKSSYIQDEEEKKLLATKSDIFELVSNSDALKHSKDVILLDDNVGTGDNQIRVRNMVVVGNLGITPGILIVGIRNIPQGVAPLNAVGNISTLFLRLRRRLLYHNRLRNHFLRGRCDYNLVLHGRGNLFRLRFGLRQGLGCRCSFLLGQGIHSGGLCLLCRGLHRLLLLCLAGTQQVIAGRNDEKDKGRGDDTDNRTDHADNDRHPGLVGSLVVEVAVAGSVSCKGLLVIQVREVHGGAGCRGS